MAKLPVRQCLICRKREPKPTLFRVVFDSDSSVLVIDEDRHIRGRAFYVHQTIECCTKVPEAGRIAKALRLPNGAVTKESVAESFLKMRQQVLSAVIA